MASAVAGAVSKGGDNKSVQSWSDAVRAGVRFARASLFPQALAYSFCEIEVQPGWDVAISLVSAVTLRSQSTTAFNACDLL